MLTCNQWYLWQNLQLNAVQFLLESFETCVELTQRICRPIFWIIRNDKRLQRIVPNTSHIGGTLETTMMICITSHCIFKKINVQSIFEKISFKYYSHLTRLTKEPFEWSWCSVDGKRWSRWNSFRRILASGTYILWPRIGTFSAQTFTFVMLYQTVHISRTNICDKYREAAGDWLVSSTCQDRNEIINLFGKLFSLWSEMAQSVQKTERLQPQSVLTLFEFKINEIGNNHRHHTTVAKSITCFRQKMSSC